MWILFIIIGIGLYELFKPKKYDFEELKQIDGKEANDYVQTCYYGGFRDISAKEIPFINFYMFEDRVRVIVNLYRKMISYTDIKREDVISVRYMNEREIKESISVGKILVFGLVGLAMRNQKEINREYIVLTCRYEGEMIDVVLNNQYVSNVECFDKLNKYINKRVSA